MHGVIYVHKFEWYGMSSIYRLSFWSFPDIIVCFRYLYSVEHFVHAHGISFTILNLLRWECSLLFVFFLMEKCKDGSEIIEIQGSIGKETLRWNIWLTLMHDKCVFLLFLTPYSCTTSIPIIKKVLCYAYRYTNFRKVYIQNCECYNWETKDLRISCIAKDKYL